MFGISYWIMPLFAACVWLATLLAMLGTWISEGSPKYSSMEPGQTIAYISDIGAQGLKPLFIAGSAVTVVVFDLVFISERYLRHKGRLAHNTSNIQKGLSIGAVIFAIIGAVGLICLTVLDTVHHPDAHDVCLVVFIAGYVVSAIFACAEYQRLGIHFRQYRVLRASFWLKLFFIFLEIALAIAFAVLGQRHHRNAAAVLEWIISLIYIIYVASYTMDFLPAVHSKHNRFPTVDEMVENGGNGPSYSGGPTFSEHGSYASENPIRAAPPITEPSRNF